MDVVWDIFQEQLFFLHHAYNFEIYAYILMSNHFHLLLRTPNENLSTGMWWFMKETSRYINQESNRKNQIWGGRFFRCMIKGEHYFYNTYKYIYQNSVKAGIAPNVLDYRYSSLRTLLGLDASFVPVSDSILFDMGVEKCLSWLNRAPTESNWLSMEAALKKSEFKFSKCRITRKPNPLEFELL